MLLITKGACAVSTRGKAVSRSGGFWKKSYAGSKMLSASTNCHESPSPMVSITNGDLEGGWQPLAPDQGLESICFSGISLHMW